MPVALLSLVLLSLYTATLSSGALGGDAGELQFVPVILGLTHPTGYPLQVFLHKTWSYVPIGTVAYRLNLLDAALAAAAVGLVSACGWLLCRAWPAPLLGAVTFGLGELWWSQAVSGDKYGLNGLFLAFVLFLFLRWRVDRDQRWLSFLALAYGLSLTHHRSMLLVGPSLAIGLALEGWRPRDRREPATLLALLLAPLSLYLYLPWAAARGLPPGSWPIDSPASFLEYLLDRGYVSQIRADATFGARMLEEGQVLLRSFGPLGVLLGIVGLVSLTRRDRTSGLVLLLAFLPQAALGASYLLPSNYALPRHWVFYLPAFLIWSLWLVAGLDQAIRWIRHVARQRTGVAIILAAGLFVLAQAPTWARAAEARVRAQVGAETLDGYRQDLQRSPLAERFGRLAFELAEPNAVVICDWEQATVLWLFQRVEELRPDVSIYYPIERLDEGLELAQREGRPLYVSRSLPGLSSRGVPSSDGPLLHLRPQPSTQAPPGTTPIETRLEDGLSLAAVRYHGTTFQPGGVIPLTLYWRPEQQLDRDYSVSVRLIGADGLVLAQHDERHPALGTSPTAGWPPGAVVGDYHELPLSNRLGPGSYRIAVVVYEPEPLRNLRQLDANGAAGGDSVTLPPFELSPRPPTLFDWALRLRG